ncbi:hypothetical protein M427DRAFT_160836 [Gonapodya prolifera JEL478]|uniref:Oxysterol-binding protein n=1 Tax=Gonapodya prolifera (strain JEL478) TaxID=1344416 RepID=A0A138ZXP4_GONPJ|nr:hypothetical protein M427DRAFT_160836 [Gonapodya prolifera JEL478]|eukprot:KXS09277.1 hypothetical protein M427DRAFT_160836 [Gonapodya prolifera JEL478]
MKSVSSLFGAGKQSPAPSFVKNESADAESASYSSSTDDDQEVEVDEQTDAKMEELMKADVEAVASAGDGEQSKLKALLGFLRNAIGVKDIASLRVSLPASVLDAISFLEHCDIMQHPELFSVINDSSDPVERMIAVVRWALSTNRLHMGKLMKSYNPIIGERFRAIWTPASSTEPNLASITLSPPSVHLEARTATPSTLVADLPPSPSSVATTIVSPPAGVGNAAGQPQVTYFAEQLAHHPPKSAQFYADTEHGVEYSGIVHMGAKFTGTSLRLRHHHGGTVRLRRPDGTMEEYRISLATPVIRGVVVLSPYMAFTDYLVITCRSTGLRSVVEFVDEKWYSRVRKFNITGRISRYDPGQASPLPPRAHHHSSSSRANDMHRNPLATLYPGETNLYALGGSWNEVVTIKSEATGQESVLLDMTAQGVGKRWTLPVESQDAMESHVVWKSVTDAIGRKDYNAATKAKHAIEDAQRGVTRAHPFSSRWFRLVVAERWAEVSRGLGRSDSQGGGLDHAAGDASEGAHAHGGDAKDDFPTWQGEWNTLEFVGVGAGAAGVHGREAAADSKSRDAVEKVTQGVDRLVVS